MGAYRDFDVARAERAQTPLTFRLGGRDFTTTGAIPAGVLLDLGDAVSSGNDMAAFGAFTQFFTAIVPADQQDDFTVAIHAVDLTTILELLNWIVEETTGRPLSKSSSSLTQSAPDGVPSRVVSLSPAETRSA